MKSVWKWMTAACLVLSLAGSGFADDSTTREMDALRGAIRANRKAVVATNLELTADEANTFWPLYDLYEKNLAALQERLAKTVTTYAAKRDALSDDDAKTLVADYLAEEVERAKLRSDYLSAFSKALPARKVARFYQLENKIDVAIRYEMAAQIPLVKP